eukprot:1325170-Rhodomonas_salina.4
MRCGAQVLEVAGKAWSQLNEADRRHFSELAAAYDADAATASAPIINNNDSLPAPSASPVAVAE